ncbi:MAG: hypothetical protein Q8O89_09100, partial [Nanoarchaeota archaeon]|nr:hypothetical protein [Nanoarchaeota archaeon]
MKKAQLSIFLLIGMVMVSTISLVIYTSNLVVQSKTQQQLEISSSLATSAGSFDDFIKNCMQNAMDDGVYLISRQGGRIYDMQVPGYDISKTDKGLPKDNPFYQFRSEEVIERELDSEVKIKNVNRLFIPIVLRNNLKDCSEPGTKKPPYYPENQCIVLPVASSSNPSRRYFFGTMPVLTPLCNYYEGPNKWVEKTGPRCGAYPGNYGDTKTMQDQLKVYVQQHMANYCFSQGDLEKIFPNLQLESNVPSADITVAAEDLTLNISYPFQVKFSMIPITKDLNYVYRYETRLQKIHEWASYILIDERNNLHFEMGKNPFSWSTYPGDTALDYLPHRPGRTNIVEITDKIFTTKGQPMKLQFALQNRNPALHLIRTQNDFGYDLVVYAGDDLNISMWAEDPDDKDISLPGFKFEFSGWMINYNESFNKTASCDFNVALKKWNEAKKLKDELATATPQIRVELTKDIELKIDDATAMMKRCSVQTKLTDIKSSWRVAQTKNIGRVSYKTSAAKVSASGAITEFGDVGLHYLAVYAIDQGGLYDYQNVSILVLPRLEGQVEVKQIYPDIPPGLISLEDILEIDALTSSAQSFSIKVLQDSTTEIYKATQNTPSIPVVGTLISEMDKHPLRSKINFGDLRTNPADLQIQITPIATIVSRMQAFNVKMLQCLPHVNDNPSSSQKKLISAPFPYNLVAIDEASNVVDLLGYAYIETKNPYLSDHMCCYGAGDEIPETSPIWGTVKPAEQSSAGPSTCFDYREDTCLVNQYEYGMEPQYPSEEHYFNNPETEEDNSYKFYSSMSYGQEESAKGEIGLIKFDEYLASNEYKEMNLASYHFTDAPLWPASKSGQRYGSGNDEIKLIFKTGIPKSENMNDVYTRQYDVYCDGKRGNVCNGTKRDSWSIREICGPTQYCAYGKSACKDWAYEKDKPMFNKACDKELFCLAGIGPDSKPLTDDNLRINPEQGRYLVRLVSDGKMTNISGRIETDRSATKSMCEGSSILPRTINGISGPAYTYNDITNNGILNITKKIFIGVDCNYYDGMSYSEEPDKFSDVPGTKGNYLHFYETNLGQIGEENALINSPKKLNGAFKKTSAADYSCGINEGGRTCIANPTDADKSCEAPNNCLEFRGTSQTYNKDGYWCNSIFGEGCIGKSCWKLGYGDAMNKVGTDKPSKDFCCGDDANENPKKCSGVSGCADAVACCKSENSCVDANGNCVDTGVTTRFLSSQTTVTCVNGEWKDLDASGKIACEAATYKYSSDSILATISGNGPCCGDDSQELWTTTGNKLCCGNKIISENTYCDVSKKWFINGAICNSDHVSLNLNGAPATIRGTQTKISADSPTLGLICGGCNSDNVRPCRNTANYASEGVCAKDGGNDVCLTTGTVASSLGYGLSQNTKTQPLKNLRKNCASKNLACSPYSLSLPATDSVFLLASGVCNSGLLCAVCSAETAISCLDGSDLD